MSDTVTPPAMTRSDLAGGIASVRGMINELLSVAYDEHVSVFLAHAANDLAAAEALTYHPMED